jgi:hypothetical protein
MELLQLSGFASGLRMNKALMAVSAVLTVLVGVALMVLLNAPDAYAMHGGCAQNCVWIELPGGPGAGFWWCTSPGC